LTFRRAAALRRRHRVLKEEERFNFGFSWRMMRYARREFGLQNEGDKFKRASSG
jgi:hypothetical protein